MKSETARREIESLDYYLQNHTDDYSEESHTAMMMGIKALEQEPCEDAISRQAALGCCRNEWEEEVEIRLKSLPSVNPQEPKTGHWIKYSISRCGEQHYKCTSCGYYINFGQWGELYTKEFKYCPNCGCRMVEPQERSDKE